MWRLLKAAHSAIKSVDPGGKVVLAGMPELLVGCTQTHLQGARRAVRCSTSSPVNPYTKQPTGVITILTKVRQVMNSARRPPRSR